MGKQVYNYTQLFNNFSENLKNKRKQLGLTQKELAETVGITSKTIQNYEKKKTIPTPALMEEISIALNVSFEEMILPINKKSIDYIKEFGKIDLEKINKLIVTINESIGELNKELDKLNYIN